MPVLAILSGIGRGIYHGVSLVVGTAKLAWQGVKQLFRGLKRVARTGKKLYKNVAKKIEQGATVTSMSLSKQGSYLFNTPPKTKAKPAAEALADKLFKEKVSTRPTKRPDVTPEKSHVFTKKNE